MKFQIIQGDKIITTLDGEFRVVPLAPPPPPQPPGYQVVRVPWVSQVTNLYSLDCGPAVWTMLAQWCGVNTTIDDLIRLMGVENQKTTSTQAIQCWRKLSLRTWQGREITTWPHLSLVYYTRLPERYDQNYTGLHFITTLGVDGRGNVAYHDPCWPTAAKGAYKLMTLGQFQAAEVSVDSRAAPLQPAPLQP